MVGDELPDPGFDRYASRYDEELHRGLRVSGESREFFAEGRIAWTAAGCARLGIQPHTVLDYGCGTGAATPLLIDLLGAESVIALDESKASLEIARQRHSQGNVRYLTPEDYVPDGAVDLVYTNGVFHHVSPAARSAVMRFIASCLRPGGVLALWENNPWNPGTRFVMSRIPFDRDAIMVSSAEARALARGAGLEVVGTEYRFIFPRALSFLRGLEPALARVPIGAQYLVLSRK